VSGQLKGAVVSVSDSGDLVTDITSHQLEGVPRDEHVSITCDGHRTLGIFTPQHQEPELTFLAILSEEGQLVLTLVGESASAFLGIRPGCRVVVTW
jgi:hypothetical protein